MHCAVETVGLLVVVVMFEVLGGRVSAKVGGLEMGKV